MVIETFRAKKVKKLDRTFRHANDEYSSFIVEMVHGIKDIKLLNSKPNFINQLKKRVVTNCINLGDVYAEYQMAAGLVASSSAVPAKATLYNCYSIGSVNCPVVPLYNINKQSELVGNQGTIDAYDLCVSKMTNNISEGDLIYWLIHNADGMTVDDDQRLMEMLHVQHLAHVDEGQIEAKTIEIPHEATDAALERLRKQLFDDFMAFDATAVAGGNVTATQITAAYQQLDNKADMFEYQIIEFVKNILAVAGMDGTPSFKRNRIANSTEETQMVLSAANILDEQTVLEHLPFISVDEVPVILERLQAEEMNRVDNIDDNSDLNGDDE